MCNVVIKQQVNGAETLCEIMKLSSNLSSVMITGNVSGKDFAHLRTGQKVHFETRATTENLLGKGKLEERH